MEEMRKWKDFVSGSEVLEIGNPESLFPPDCAETQSKHRFRCLAAGQKQTRQIGPETSEGQEEREEQRI